MWNLRGVRFAALTAENRRRYVAQVVNIIALGTGAWVIYAVLR